jgi:hypothetical protein
LPRKPSRLPVAWPSAVVALFLGALGGCKVTHEFATCRFDGECRDGKRCGPDGYCIVQGQVIAEGGPVAPSDAASDARGEAGSDAAGACEAGSCPAGQICSNGRCIAPLEDRDTDGIPAGSDCDDRDRSVGTTAQRACKSECAGGIERCVMGQWQACDAPTACTCVPDEQRTVNCGNCGTRNQVCNSQGKWADVGTCIDEGECSVGVTEDLGPCGKCGTEKRTCLSNCVWGVPACRDEGVCADGEADLQSEPCGVCGSERTRRRTCDEACQFSEWSAWSGCADTGRCQANETVTATENCGNCNGGTRKRARTCDAGGCGWGAWAEWSACEGAPGCAPSEAGSENAGCGNCNSGTQTRSRTCDGSCAWGGWGTWGTCSGATGCVPNDTVASAVSCTAQGNCNTVTTCGATCTWGEPQTTCSPCAPGEDQPDFGGRCGPASEFGIRSRVRVCDGGCAWGSWGAWICEL